MEQSPAEAEDVPFAGDISSIVIRPGEDFTNIGDDD